MFAFWAVVGLPWVGVRVWLGQLNSIEACWLWTAFLLVYCLCVVVQYRLQYYGGGSARYLSGFITRLTLTVHYDAAIAFVSAIAEASGFQMPQLL